MYDDAELQIIRERAREAVATGKDMDPSGYYTIGGLAHELIRSREQVRKLIVESGEEFKKREQLRMELADAERTIQSLYEGQELGVLIDGMPEDSALFRGRKGNPSGEFFYFPDWPSMDAYGGKTALEVLREAAHDEQNEDYGDSEY